MGNLAHRLYEPGGHSPYAPQWARDPCARRHNQLRTADLAEDNTSRAEESIGSILARAGDPLRPETDLSVNHFLERSLQPDIVPYPWSTSPRARLPFKMLDMILAVSAAVVVALVMIGKFPPTGSIGASDSPGAASFAARFVGQTSAGPTAGQIGPASALSHSPMEPSAERRL